MTQDLILTPLKRLTRDVARFEDVQQPYRPPAPPRQRRGLWAPPGPELLEPPQMLVVGLGRSLRPTQAEGPRARLGAGAIEALERRYEIGTFFDIELRGYVSTCKASLDKSGRAGVQTIHMFQPVLERDGDVANAMLRMMERDSMGKAMILFVMSDYRLPFGQLRMRTTFDESDPRIKSAYAVLGPENRVTVLHIGAGQRSPNEAFLASEVGALPRVLGNAATAIEVWLSEADLGLVMRFVNRPELYEMPPGWPHSQALEHKQRLLLEAGVEKEDEADDHEHASALQESEQPESSSLESYNLGSLIGPAPGDEFALFDLNREDQSEPPNPVLAPMSPAAALEALAERPVSSSLMVAGRRFASVTKLQQHLVYLMLNMQPGWHMRMKDDEDAVRFLLHFHPDAPRLLEDLVAIKVDTSPVDDETRCLWAVKFDGQEEDISLKACLLGLRKYLEVAPSESTSTALLSLAEEGQTRPLRLGPGRWRRGLRDSAFDRGTMDELNARKANM